MQEFLDYREYQTLRPSEKLRSLKKFWGLADSAEFDFIGEVRELFALENHFLGDASIKVQPLKVEPLSKALSLVENPFNRKLSDIKLIPGIFIRANNDPAIQIGSWISFKIKIRPGQLEEEQPVQIDQIVKRFESYAELDPFIPESFPELQKRIQSIHRMAYISVPEDIFDVMNEELGKKINAISELETRITEMRAEKDQYSTQLAALQTEKERLWIVVCPECLDEGDGNQADSHISSKTIEGTRTPRLEINIPEKSATKREVRKNFIKVFNKACQDNPKDSSRGSYGKTSWQRNRSWVLAEREKIRENSIRKALLSECRECETCELERSTKIRSCKRYVEETTFRWVFDDASCTIQEYCGSSLRNSSTYSPEEYKRRRDLEDEEWL